MATRLPIARSTRGSVKPRWHTIVPVKAVERGKEEPAFRPGSPSASSGGEEEIELPITRIANAALAQLEAIAWLARGRRIDTRTCHAVSPHTSPNDG